MTVNMLCLVVSCVYVVVLLNHVGRTINLLGLLYPSLCVISYHSVGYLSLVLLLTCSILHLKSFASNQ